METKLIAFSGQKGGIGKSSFTALAASYYSYVKGMKVCVIDADFPQYSILHMRARDIKLLQDDAYFRQLVKTQMGKTGNSFPVKKSMPDDAIELADSLKTGAEKFEVILIDMPGTLNNPGIIRTLCALDYVFAPISANEVDMDSTFGFVSFVQEKIVRNDKFSLKGVYPFWNKVTISEKNPLYEVYDKSIAELGITQLQTTIPNTVKFNKEAVAGCKTHFIGTFLPPHKKIVENSRIPELFEETLTLINQ